MISFNYKYQIQRYIVRFCHLNELQICYFLSCCCLPTILGLKAEKKLRNHTEDWALGFHPGENGHVIH